MLEAKLKVGVAKNSTNSERHTCYNFINNFLFFKGQTQRKMKQAEV